MLVALVLAHSGFGHGAVFVGCTHRQAIDGGGVFACACVHWAGCGGQPLGCALWAILKVALHGLAALNAGAERTCGVARLGCDRADGYYGVGLGVERKHAARFVPRHGAVLVGGAHRQGIERGAVVPCTGINVARGGALPVGFAQWAILEVGLHGLAALNAGPERGCGVAGFGLLGAHRYNRAAALNHHQRVAFGFAVAAYVNINGLCEIGYAERVGAVGGFAGS